MALNNTSEAVSGTDPGTVLGTATSTAALPTISSFTSSPATVPTPSAATVPNFKTVNVTQGGAFVVPFGDIMVSPEDSVNLLTTQFN